MAAESSAGCAGLVQRSAPPPGSSVAGTDGPLQSPKRQRYCVRAPCVSWVPLMRTRVPPASGPAAGETAASAMGRCSAKSRAPWPKKPASVNCWPLSAMWTGASTDSARSSKRGAWHRRCALPGEAGLLGEAE